MLISTVKNMECIQPTTQVTIVMETATVTLLDTNSIVIYRNKSTIFIYNFLSV